MADGCREKGRRGAARGKMAGWMLAVSIRRTLRATQNYNFVYAVTYHCPPTRRRGPVLGSRELRPSPCFGLTCYPAQTQRLPSSGWPGNLLWLESFARTITQTTITVKSGASANTHQMTITARSTSEAQPPTNIIVMLGVTTFRRRPKQHGRRVVGWWTA